jgi:hypothetical protein
LRNKVGLLELSHSWRIFVVLLISVICKTWVLKVASSPGGIIIFELMGIFVKDWTVPLPRQHGVLVSLGIRLLMETLNIQIIDP